MNERDTILSMTNNGYDIFRHYLPDVDFRNKRNFTSPFYSDSNASCTIFLGKDGMWHYKDHGNAGVDSGDIFWFVAKRYGLDTKKEFRQVLDVIIKDMGLCLSSPINEQHLGSSSSRQTVSSSVSEQSSDETKEGLPYEYKSRPFTSLEKEYWGKYGITEDILSKYGVHSLAEYSSTTKSGKAFTLHGSDENPVFLYDFGTACKVYQPFNSRCRFLQGGVKPENYAFGHEQLPLRGRMLFITGGEKDVLSLASHGFNAICFNSETSSIPEIVIKNLSRRFTHLIILYDMDQTGKKASSEITKQFSEYNLQNISLPLKGTKEEKDISDFFALGNSAQDFYDHIINTSEEQKKNDLMTFETHRTNYNNPPIPSNSIVSFQGTVIGASENLLCITGEEGSGKSNYIGAIIAGAISSSSLDSSMTLGLEITPNPHHKAVLHFDTEQSESQLYKNGMRSFRRAGITGCPPYYYSICLTPVSRKERLQVIMKSIEHYDIVHQGIHLVLIDGIADLIYSANDERQAIALIEGFHQLAITYNTCIVCVLHYIPDGIKLRGHLGSEIQRKAAGILAIEKCKDDEKNSVVKALKIRDGSCYDVPMMLFGWDYEKGMHVYKGVKTLKEQEKRKRIEMTAIVKDILRHDPHPTLEEFSKQLQIKQGNINEKTVRKHMNYLFSHEIIKLADDEQTIQPFSPLVNN